MINKLVTVGWIRLEGDLHSFKVIKSYFNYIRSGTYWQFNWVWVKNSLQKYDIEVESDSKIIKIREFQFKSSSPLEILDATFDRTSPTHDLTFYTLLQEVKDLLNLYKYKSIQLIDIKKSTIEYHELEQSDDVKNGLVWIIQEDSKSEENLQD